MSPQKKPIRSGSVDNLLVIMVKGSAQDLPALKVVLSEMRETANYCLILSIQSDSQEDTVLVEELRTYTQLSITRVDEAGQVLLEACGIYIIAPGTCYELQEGKLSQCSGEEESLYPAPLDHLLTELANSFVTRSVALVLSGNDSDGLAGTRAIKAMGGFVVVLDTPEVHASYLPQAIIQAGYSDLKVTDEQQINRELERLLRACRHAEVSNEQVISEEDYARVERILMQIRAVCDHDFSLYRITTVMRRIRRRLPLCNLDSLEAYADYLSENRDETLQLYEDLLITVTEFFRDAEVFSKLADEVIPRLFEGKGPKDTVRVWSAGCATGEEAYSLAILLEEYASQLKEPPSIIIFASDVHLRALQRAKDGYYPSLLVESLSEARLSRFFSKVNDNYRVKKFLRDKIVFAAHSMLRDPPFSRLDLVSCRNVLIYFKRDVQRRLLELFHYSLREGGYLLIGSAESVEDSEVFRAYNKDVNLYRRHNVTNSKLHIPVAIQNDPNRTTTRVVSKHAEAKGISYGALHQSVVEQYGPPSVLVNSEYKIVHFSDLASRYLFQPSGEPDNSIFKRIRNELRIELRASLFTASREKKNVRSKSVPMRIDGDDCTVAVRVNPAGVLSGTDGYLLIWFEEIAVSADQENKVSTSGKESDLQAIELELEETRNRLQALFEEFETSQADVRSSNEELQSTNEELRSTMEELETGKEELQSMNEELTTLNIENRRKVDELSRLTNDLNNFLDAAEIATICLDDQLRILRFTPETTRFFNIRNTDLGRPLTELNIHFEYDNLKEDTAHVIKSHEPIEREVLSGRRWFQLRILPYLVSEDNTNRIIISLHDITRLKEVEASAYKHSAGLEALKVSLESKVEERTKVVRELAGRITIAEQAERDRVAQILHDDLLQELCGLQMEIQLELEAKQLEPNMASELSERLGQLMELTRRLTVDLSPPLLKSEGLADGLRYLRSVMQQDYGLEVKLSHDHGIPVWNKDLRILLFQVIRELLINACKRAAVKEISISMRQTDAWVYVAISAEGKGFDADILKCDSKSEYGPEFLDLAHRLDFVGGKVYIDTTLDSGGRIKLEIPNEKHELSNHQN